MKKTLILSGLVFLTSQALASVKLKPWKLNEGRSHVLYENNGNLKGLERDVFSDSISFDRRWQLVHEIARLKEKPAAVAFLKKCLKSKTWFLQSAGLKSLSKIDPASALISAKGLLQNAPSLVVRSEAAQVIGEFGNQRDIKSLWGSMYDKKNFRKRQSLWIRPQIAKILAKKESLKNLRLWKDLTTDSSPVVKKIALRVLNKN